MKTILLLTIILLLGCSGEPEVKTVERLVYQVTEIGIISDDAKVTFKTVDGQWWEITTTDYYEIITPYSLVGKPYQSYFDEEKIIFYDVRICSTTVDTICYEQKGCE